MLTWPEFRNARLDLADAGRAIFYQFGVGLAFLATVRRDGGPRAHPMCPIITEGGLYALIEPGPKLGDLRRDGRYAMHAFPPADNEDAFYITGTAREIDDAGIHASVLRCFLRERSIEALPPEGGRSRLFEFFIDTCMLTRTTGHGDYKPQHAIWKASSS